MDSKLYVGSDWKCYEVSFYLKPTVLNLNPFYISKYIKSDKG